jgi:aspartate 1-decarboxylase
MMIKIVRAKMHGIHVTASALDYHGSITLDPEHCKAAGIFPMEFVDVWNKNSGKRISTYVIYGERGSKCCILNGAAARTCQIGDELIICASEYIVEQEEILDKKPKILCFDDKNNISEVLRYETDRDEKGDVSFRINVVSKNSI